MPLLLLYFAISCLINTLYTKLNKLTHTHTYTNVISTIKSPHRETTHQLMNIIYQYFISMTKLTEQRRTIIPE